MESGGAVVTSDEDAKPAAVSPVRGVFAIVWPFAIGTVLATALIVSAYADRLFSDRPTAMAAAEMMKEIPTEVRGFAIDVEAGHSLYMGTCSSCHGTTGEGMPMQGANLQRSYFVSSRTNEQLLAFLILGRQPGDRFSVLGRAMPARGGNPELNDADLADIVGFLRRMQSQPQPTAAGLSTIAAVAPARR